MGVFNFNGFRRSNEVSIDRSTLRMITEANGLGGITWNGISSLETVMYLLPLTLSLKT